MAYKNRVVVSATSDGANTVVSAVPGKKIVVLDGVLTTIGTGGFTWKSGSTALSGVITPVAGTPIVMARNNEGYLHTAASEALVITTAAGVDVTGHLTISIES